MYMDFSLLDGAHINFFDVYGFYPFIWAYIKGFDVYGFYSFILGAYKSF